MDCLSLLEHSSGNKSLHIANATQLFTFNQIYTLNYWSQLALMHYVAYTDTESETKLYLAFATYHSSSTQKQLFADEGDLHLCESPAEFLLEPWLLMQVPWHPAVYYQWLIAALAEELKAMEQLVEFYVWPVPKRLVSAVCKLLMMVEKLHQRLLCGFRLINWLANDNKDSCSRFDTNCQTVQSILNLVILPSLPTIEFLVGDKFNIMANALKRMAWPSEGRLTAEEELVAKLSRGVTQDDGLLPLYTLIPNDEEDIAHLFGKVGSFQEINEELVMLPCTIDFVSMKSTSDEVSYG
jgi:hypothetical protein